LVSAAVLLVGVVCGLVVSRSHHQAKLVDGLTCSSDRTKQMVIDYSWTSGPSSPAAALDAFLHSVHAKGLPTSGYARPNALPVVPRTGDVTPSVQTAGFAYVHATHGRVDVGLRIDKLNGIFEVGEVSACA
jgi:hypothetical protein